MFKKIRLHHYANYIVIGLLTLIFGIITLAGGRFDNSMLFLLEKVAISIILAVSLSLVVSYLLVTQVLCVWELTLAVKWLHSWFRL